MLLLLLAQMRHVDSVVIGVLFRPSVIDAVSLRAQGFHKLRSIVGAGSAAPSSPDIVVGLCTVA